MEATPFTTRMVQWFTRISVQTAPWLPSNTSLGKDVKNTREWNGEEAHNRDPKINAALL